ncbi:MAG: EAL domain-containing protein [Thermoleophilaceae bacterium]|nr:EAL domain-containing protein [Thermoleophilaceae bacterium]
MDSPTNRPPEDPVFQLFELSLDMLGTASAEGYFTHLNPAWERTLGWTNEELMAEPFISFVHPDDVEKTVAAAATIAGGSPVIAFENRYRKRDGEYLWLQWTTVARDGVLYSVTHEITNRKKAEAKAEGAAALARAIADSVVDGLYVVDTEGLLAYVNPAAMRMLGYQSEEELLGRKPHPTFHHTRADGTPFPVEECPLAAATGKPIHVEEDTFWRTDGTALPVSCSVTPITLAEGTGSVIAFRDISLKLVERDRTEALGRHVAWFDQVREALIDGRFMLYGQPIVSLSSGEILYHELLLRMVAKTGEIIAPGEFLPAAEKYGLINDVDRWVIAEAVALAATGQSVSANLSAKSMGRGETLLHIEHEIERTGAAAEDLTFEVTETALMLDVKAGRRFADRLVALGCSLSLDDFGTGYGSLTYLREFPISLVKIDIQFVREMATSEPDRALVQSIVHMANALGKETVAEGVGDEQTLELLRRDGVDYAQGYHLGRPAPLSRNPVSQAEAAAARESPATDGAPSSQTESDGLTARDESARLRDVAAFSRDLAADERDHVAEHEQEARLAREGAAGRARLEVSAGAREDAAADRASAAGDRDSALVDRGEAEPDGHAGTGSSDAARKRDTSAGSRDVAADARDLEAGRGERRLVADEATIADAQVEASERKRENAAADRESAATDRKSAASDRDSAAADGRRATQDLEHAQLDGLTGAYGGDLGKVMLQNEIDRSRGSGEPFVLACVDVDNLKKRNDDLGHAAGDALLKSVVTSLKAGLRSYDPVVRVGGDEFLCGLSNMDLEAGAHRMEGIQKAVEQAEGSITVGLARLGGDDSLEQLTARADKDMYAHKRR